MKSLLPVILVGLGIFLLVLGFLWTLIFPATRTWTEKKSQRMTELQNETHKLLFLAERAKTRPISGGPSPSEAREIFDKSEAELNTLKAEFEGIRDNPANTGTYLRWAGSAFVLLGGIAVMAAREG